MAPFIELIDQISTNAFPCSVSSPTFMYLTSIWDRNIFAVDASKASATQNQKSNIFFWLISQDSWLLPLCIALWGKQAALDHRAAMHSKLPPQERKHDVMYSHGPE